jgi:hypothetical protein
MSVTRREFLVSGASAALWLASRGPIAYAAGDSYAQYNGIVLRDPWPPREALSVAPSPPPYLVSPPAVIPIDVGRQLFVDDFLVESTTLQRVFHQAQAWRSNPVLAPDQPWERRRMRWPEDIRPGAPTAMVFSDGVFYDAAEKLFKMWYMAGYNCATGYATSTDGMAWIKPRLDVVAGTNLVLAPLNRDSATIWIDRAPRDGAPYKMLLYRRENEHGGPTPLLNFESRDGIHWRATGAALDNVEGDRHTVFYNPFRAKWIYSLRLDKHGSFGRYRGYAESDRFGVIGAAVDWIAADTRDEPRADLQVKPELYNLDAVAYESVLLGLFTIFRGDRRGGQKINEVLLGFSRDGFHWARPDRRAFIGVSDDPRAWNHGNVQSAGGCCLVVGDRLHFYVSGRRGDPERDDDSVCSTGLFTLRRDGFASMAWPPAGADGSGASRAGVLTTRPVRFRGRHLFVNAHVPPDGELRVEVLDEAGRALDPYTRALSVPITGDAVTRQMRWSGGDDLGALAGRPLRFRFILTRGHLYAFWVSATRTGRSGGFLAAGGPGFAEPRDQ